MKGFDFIDQYLIILKRIRRCTYEVSKEFFAGYVGYPYNFLVMELCLAQVQLIYYQKQRLIILPRGGGFETQQEIVDHAYDIVYFSASVAFRLKKSDIRSEMKQLISDYFSLMSNIVIEETNEQQKKNCFSKSNKVPFIFDWEMNSEIFIDAVYRAAERIKKRDLSSVLWVWDINEGRKEILKKFQPENFLYKNMDHACFLAEQEDYTRAYVLLDEIVNGGITENKKLLSQSLYNVAEIFRNKNMFEKALECYKKALDFYQDAWIWGNMGITYISIGDWESAYKCMKNALRLDPYDLPAIDGMINCLISTGRLELLHDYYYQLLELYHKKPFDMAAKFLGFICYTLKDFENALFYFRTCMEEIENDWEYLYYYAISLYHMHETTNARIQLRKGVAMLEEGVNEDRKKRMYLTIVYYYIDSPILDRAIESMEEFQNQYGSAEQLDFLNIVMYIEYNMGDEYKNLLQIGLDMLKHIGDVSYYREVIEELEKQHQKWNQWMNEKPVKMLNGDISSLTRKLLIQNYIFECCAFEQLGEFNRALEMCENALYWDSTCPEALFQKAWIMEYWGKFSEALEIYKKAHSFQTDDEKREDIEYYIQRLEIYLTEM